MIRPVSSHFAQSQFAQSMVRVRVRNRVGVRDRVRKWDWANWDWAKWGRPILPGDSSAEMTKKGKTVATNKAAVVH